MGIAGKNYIAVLDTETNWDNEVMSLGVVIADAVTFQAVDQKYYILTPEHKVGGMFSYVLHLRGCEAMECCREEVMADLETWLHQHGVKAIFAYNARFDYSHLEELSSFCWYDIIRIAAYRQHNVKIPRDAACCKTGRLKCNYGVEPMLQLLREDRNYRETHNALQDALDELEIMRLLDLHIDTYACAQIQ